MNEEQPYGQLETGTWLTKAELARVRRISVASADRLIRRQGWRRQPGNDGRVRVLIPLDWLRPHHGDPTDDAADDHSNPTDIAGLSNLAAGALDALEDAVSVLREQLDAANARADRAEQGKKGARQRADDRQAQIEVLNAELVVMRDDRQMVQARLEQQVDELRAGQKLMMDMHARALAAAQDRLERMREAAEGLRQAEVERNARHLPVRLWKALRGR